MNYSKKTAIIILNFNNASATRNCIESVKKFNSAPVKFIIIDNGSRKEEYDALIEVINEEFSSYMLIDSKHQHSENVLEEVVLVRSEENLGYARGNNLGLVYVYSDPTISNILILNNDILFVEDLIPKFLSASEELTDFAIITPLLLKKDGINIDYNCARRQVRFKEIILERFLFYWWRFRGKTAQEIFPDRYLVIDFRNSVSHKEIQLPSGSCMFIRKEFFKSIGGFDPHTFLYQEENILYEKIKRTGKKNYILPDAKCIHLGSDTISGVPNQVQIMKRAIKSEDYFVTTYLNLAWYQKLIYKISKWFFITSFTIQKALVRKKMR